jgi:hypothetical protein
MGREHAGWAINCAADSVLFDPNHGSLRASRYLVDARRPRFSTGSTSRYSNRPDDQVKPIVPYKTLCISQEDRCSSGVTAASAMRWMMAAATDAIFSEDTETGAADAMMCGRWLPAIHGASSRRRPDDATLFRHTFAFIPDTGRANRFWDQSSTTCHRVRERNMRIAASGRNAK